MEKRIMQELQVIKKDLHFIKEHMVDADMILTSQEKTELDESLKELKDGKTFSLEAIKRDRKNA